MLYAGLPPVIANASNAVAIMPGHLLAAIADRKRLPPPDQRMIVLSATSLIGGVAGAVILRLVPETAFTKPIPALIGFATLLFAFAPTIQSWTAAQPHLGFSSQATASMALGLASIYGGFFGAALGVIITVVLSITEVGDLRSINSLKNLLAVGVSFAATAIFIQQGLVQWPETSVMLFGALLGGYAGGGLIRILPASWVRAGVIVAGLFMFGLYAKRYWL